MSLSPRSAVLFSATFASLLLLSACGKSETPAPAPTASSTAPAPAAPAAASTAKSPAASSTAAAVAPAATTATAPAAAATAATPTAAAGTPLSFSKLTVGDAVNGDRQVTKASTTFAPTDKTIYASVATDGSSTGAKLNAKWTYTEGKGVLVSNITQSIATDGPAVTTFKVQNPDLWPEGKYKVEILLDGKSVASQDFDIAKR